MSLLIKKNTVRSLTRTWFYVSFLFHNIYNNLSLVPVILKAYILIWVITLHITIYISDINVQILVLSINIRKIRSLKTACSKTLEQPNDPFDH